MPQPAAWRSKHASDHSAKEVRNRAISRSSAAHTTGNRRSKSDSKARRPRYAFQMEKNTVQRRPARDGRFGVGIAVTIAWVGMIVLYMAFNLDRMAALEPNAFGDFLAGAFGPIALLWLVLGYMQQGEELQQNTEALRLQAAELKASVEEQRNMVQVARDQIDVQLATRSSDLEDARLLVRPSFAAKIFTTNPSLEETDQYWQWQIVIQSNGPMCRNLTAQLAFQQENSYFVFVDLEQNGGVEWSGRLFHRTGPKPSAIHLLYTTSRNEREYQSYKLRRSSDNGWQSSEIPKIVLTNPVHIERPIE